MTDHRSVSAFLAALAARFPDLETIRSDEPKDALDGENVREPAQEPGLVLRPHPGPQTRFLASSGFMALYRGEGGGKTWALIYAAVLHATSTPGWAGLIVRNEAVDLDPPGGLWDTAQELAALTGGHCRGGSPRDITWPGGGRLVFDYLAQGNYKNYRGARLAYLGIDEANECPIKTIVILVSRLRSTCGAMPIVRMTCNDEREAAPWT